MVKLIITAHCNEDIDSEPEKVLNTVKKFCVNKENMRWVENEDYPKFFDGQSIKLLCMIDGEYDEVQNELLDEFRSGNNPLFHRLKVEMK